MHTKRARMEEEEGGRRRNHPSVVRLSEQIFFFAVKTLNIH